MSGEAMGWAMRHRTGDGSSAHVLLRLAMRADEVGAMTLIDADYLAEVCEISRATVFRCLRTLRDLGLLETETGFSRSGGRRVSARLLLHVTSVQPNMQKTHSSDEADDAGEGEGSLKSGLPQNEVVSNLDDLKPGRSSQIWTKVVSNLDYLHYVLIG